MSEWLRLAVDLTVVRRALKYALIVGTVLICINHGDALLQGGLTATRALQMALTAIVPYCVSTFSSIEALRTSRSRAGA